MKNRTRWRWPQFSLRELLIVSLALGILWSVLSSRLERDELIMSVIGSFVLLWCLLCWRTVRINRDFFQINKHRENNPRKEEIKIGQKIDGEKKNKD